MTDITEHPTRCGVPAPARSGLSWQRQPPAYDYNPGMSTTKPKSATAPKVTPPPAKRRDLSRGLPGTDRERAEQRRRFAEEHRETLRRLGN
jgi:hypothetical protein